MNNLIHPQKWNKRLFLSLVVSIQLAILGSIGLDYINNDIPLLRQTIGFIYLTFIPGLIILRIFNKQEINPINYILYSIGLSITFMMFFGYLLNTLGPFLGIKYPLSSFNLIASISTLIILLISCIWKFENKQNNHVVDINFSEAYSPKLLLFLIPIFLSAIGSWYANSYGNSIILVIFATTVPIFALIAIYFQEKSQVDFYPFVIYILSLSLLLHYSLISRYLFGYDIHYEYYTFEVVKSNLIWDSTNPVFSVNSMLSVTILPTIYHYFLNLDGTWVYKIVFQSIFAFVPVALYQIYQSQTIKWVAFLSVFFFISQITFFTEMTMLARQEIAELFLVLAFLSVLDKSINSVTHKVLIILFSISIVVSHYGISYVYLIYLSLILFIIAIVNRFKFKTISNSINFQFFILIFVFCISWYMFHSYSSAFNGIIAIADQMIKTMITDLFSSSYKDPVISTALGNNPIGVSKLHLIHIYFKRFTFLFIVVGFIEYVFRNRMIRAAITDLFSFKFQEKYQLNIISRYVNRMNLRVIDESIFRSDRQDPQLDLKYTSFNVTSFVFLFLSIFLPFASSNWNMTRIFHISLLFLSPFAIFGCWRIISLISELFKLKLNSNHISLLTILFFILFFMFEVSLMNVYFGEPGSAALDMNHQNMVSLSGALTHEQEVYSAKWLSYNREISNDLYADSIANQHVLTSYGHIFSNQRTLSTEGVIPTSSYIYMRFINTIYKIIPIFNGEWISENISDVIPELPIQDKIYSNGGSEIYFTNKNISSFKSSF